MYGIKDVLKARVATATLAALMTVATPNFAEAQSFTPEELAQHKYEDNRTLLQLESLTTRNYKIPDSEMHFNTEAAIDGRRAVITDPELVKSNAARGVFQRVSVKTPVTYRELVGRSAHYADLLHDNKDAQATVLLGVVCDIDEGGKLSAESLRALKDTYTMANNVIRGSGEFPGAAEMYGAYITEIRPIIRNPDNLDREPSAYLEKSAYMRLAVRDPNAADEDLVYQGEPLEVGQVAIFFNDMPIYIRGEHRANREGLMTRQFLMEEDLPRLEEFGNEDYVALILRDGFARMLHAQTSVESGGNSRNIAQVLLAVQQAANGEGAVNENGSGSGGDSDDKNDIPPSPQL